MIIHSTLQIKDQTKQIWSSPISFETSLPNNCWWDNSSLFGLIAVGYFTFDFKTASRQHHKQSRTTLLSNWLAISISWIYSTGRPAGKIYLRCWLHWFHQVLKMMQEAICLWCRNSWPSFQDFRLPLRADGDTIPNPRNFIKRLLHILMEILKQEFSICSTNPVAATWSPISARTLVTFKPFRQLFYWLATRLTVSSLNSSTDKRYQWKDSL